MDLEQTNESKHKNENELDLNNDSQKNADEINSKISEDFASCQKNNEDDNNEILGEIELLNPKGQTKSRYPKLEVETKNTEENNENFREESNFFKETPFLENSRQYLSLKDRRTEFSSFLSNLGWKSKSYLKNNDEYQIKSKEIDLTYNYKQNLIISLNANICDFRDSDVFLKENIEKFRLEGNIRDNNLLLFPFKMKTFIFIKINILF